MKGFALEFVFKMFLYIVVILVVISLIIHFKDEILSSLHLCDYLPGGCPSKQECSTIQASEAILTESVIEKYCSFCWQKTGLKDYAKDCICYVVSGTFSPAQFTLSDHCSLKCNKEATSLIFSYNHLLKKVFIEC
ncbi:MAG: hypothetical protein QXU74_03640 [Candidatus Aenigmatarchaeota archaeon]